MDFKPFLQNKWLLWLGALGIICLLFGSFWNRSGGSLPTMAQPDTGSGQSAVVSASNTDLNQSGEVDAALAYASAYDKQLSTILKQIVGVNDVHVMVTLDSTDLVTLANNVKKTEQTETSGKSTTHSTTTDTQVFTQSNNGNSVPYVVQNVAPKVRGVLVTVSAADFYVAKAEIIDAITNVLDVPAYKISVEPEKNNS